MNDKVGNFLAASDAAYQVLLRAAGKLHRKKKYEQALRFIQSVIQFAEKCHPGRYADGAIENLVFSIGENLDALVNVKECEAGRPFDSPAAAPGGKRRMLHVATTVYRVGGHTRLIERWLEADPDSCHSLVLADQSDAGAIPESLARIIKASGGSLINFPHQTPLLMKSWWLRKLAAAGFDLVILHTHPHDVLPVVAFASPSLPPVAVMNHADHVFWIGSSVADLLIEYKAFGLEFSKRRRFAKETMLLPLRIDGRALGVSRESARQVLGIPPEGVVLLSMGSSYKFTPSASHNFFKSGRRILEQCPAAHIFLIGVTWDDRIEYLRESRHDRFHLVGVIEDPSTYEAAADIYLDSFPLGSGTALLEACAFGSCPVPVYAPERQFNLCDDIPGLRGLLDHPGDEREYVARVVGLIDNSEKRREIGRLIREQVLEFHYGNGWREQLEKIYHYMQKARHSPVPLPLAEKRDDHEDLILSTAHQVCYARAPRLLNYAFEYWPVLELRDLFRMCLCSRRLGDVNGRPIFFLRCWLRVLEHKLSGRRQTPEQSVETG